MILHATTKENKKGTNLLFHKDKQTGKKHSVADQTKGGGSNVSPFLRGDYERREKGGWW